MYVICKTYVNVKQFWIYKMAVMEKGYCMAQFLLKEKELSTWV